MKKIVISLSSIAILCITAVTTTAMAADAAAGKEKTTSCAGCHGMEGISDAGMFPNLAGQHAEYLESALKDYREGARENDMMSPMAKGLTDEDIADIAAYYSSVKGK